MKIYNKFIASLLMSAGLLHALPSLRVMSYNIRREGKEKQEDRLWTNRLPRIVALLKTINPDVVGLQEVIEHQKEQLQESFPDMNFVGTSRGSCWWGLATDEATPIGYKKDRLELQDHGTFPVNAESNSWFGWMPWHRAQTGLLPRICTWAKFKDKASNKEFYIYNTHLDHMYDQARLLSAQKIMDDIKERTTGYSVMVTGDFNTPIEGEMKTITNSLIHAKDKAEQITGPRETSTGWDSTTLTEIDHILVNKFIDAVKTYRVVESEGYPSDHRPVVADIQM